jgi:hypothetical protein
MGMPMGGLGGAPGGAAGGGGGKPEDARRRKVVVPEIPHTEDVTRRVYTNRLSAAATAATVPELSHPTTTTRWIRERRSCAGWFPVHPRTRREPWRRCGFR